ncbi:hypothetical protein HN840_03045 [archaeon]|jgi:hypothetical protein|nr:hypothetical protein [archaeon]MBT3730805.1 hypothetical protein [archaeon]MBT4670119.1 hypothetical protein [archaeon]MBT5030580.1 hypothetical protein [archaeon]MBT5287933.1 hypothetical protein [archaeon]
MKETLPGTLRIKTKDLQVYEKTKSSWKKSKVKFPNASQVIKLFKKSKNLKSLIDKNDPNFLKGQLSSEGKCQGARINILPNNKTLDKAYSLFANHLTIHDQKSNEHWDVLLQNPGGTYAYIYTLDKKSKAKLRKYKKVKEFDKHYPLIKRKVTLALKNKNDHLALPMYTLLNTYMRVGNEIYFKAHGHKGLTTLKKKDIKIKGKEVTFNYLAKDGVPRTIKKNFPPNYLRRLNKKLKDLKTDSFVFTGPNGHPLKDTKFKEAFKSYCGKEFYPHIVRSHHASLRAREFLKTHKTTNKKEMKEFFLSLAQDLGHKKFSKKENIWKESYTVTLNHYVDPELVEKIRALV